MKHFETFFLPNIGKKYPKHYTHEKFGYLVFTGFYRKIQSQNRQSSLDIEVSIDFFAQVYICRNFRGFGGFLRISMDLVVFFS